MLSGEEFSCNNINRSPSSPVNHSRLGHDFTKDMAILDSKYSEGKAPEHKSIKKQI